MIISSATELIGGTPVLKLDNVKKELDLNADLYGKLEYLNASGSVKDRIAKAMIEDAESKGLLSPSSVIIEPTSGNTGIGLAAVCAMKNYRCILVMPESMSVERRKMLKAYGAELVLSPASMGMRGAIEKANELLREISGAFMPGQFTNPANPLAHYKTTGPEIFSDLNGKIDFFVAGVGTGGTISGVGKYLKEKIKGVKIIAVEPKSSAVLSGNPSGKHAIQGIGAGFVPDTLNKDVIDEIIPVSDEDALEYARTIGKTEGVLAGISSGAALKAAAEIASRKENAGKNVVVLFPDGGDRYLSTALYEQ